MKAIIRISILFLVLTASFSFAGAKPKKATIVVCSSNGEVFRFKVDKKFLGAKIEVYDSSNTLTGKEIVYDRKMIIDFYYMPADTYRIIIMTEDELIEFQFKKK